MKTYCAKFEGGHFNGLTYWWLKRLGKARKIIDFPEHIKKSKGAIWDGPVKHHYYICESDDMTVSTVDQVFTYKYHGQFLPGARGE